MAIAFDAVSSTNTGDSTTSLSWNHTCSGTNLCLIVAIGSNGATATGVTYNSVAMTQVGVQQEGSTGYRVSLWKLVNPTSGTNSITAAFAAGQAVECRACSFTGVDPTTPNGTFASATGNASAAVSTTVTSAAGELVVDAVVWNQNGFPANESVGAGQTEEGVATGVFTRCAMSIEAGAASVAMTWTMSANTNWTQCGVSLKPVAAASTSIAFANSSTVQNSTAGTSIVITKPTGTVDGDTMFAALTWTSGTVTVSAAPAGWTLIGNTTTGVSNQIYVATYYKVASGEGASYTWTLTGTGINNCGTIWRITGAHATTPFDTFAGQTGTASQATGPTITTSNNGELICLVAGYSSNQTITSFSTPSGFTARDALFNGGPSREATFSEVQAGAGATGAVATVASGVIASDYWAAQLVAFKPPAVSIDPRQIAIEHFMVDASSYAQRAWPLSYTGFINQDVTAPTLVATAPWSFSHTDLPFEYAAPPWAELFPQFTFAAPQADDTSTPTPSPGFLATQSIGPRISLPPPTLIDDAQWQRQAAAWMNEANQGHLQNTGIITLVANANTSVVIDDRVAANSFIGFMPRTANAALEFGNGTLYVSSQGKQTFTITHANNAQTDRTFIYSILG